ncbi:UDP-glucose 4-epimerase GalE [Magnetovirga frankeli]|uniref:UDP-glucose 4-epimerase GalE n=1 Tax=Magnetovirga frankeli TaxID=947516 RepID=UPI001293CB7B|nr:UDP-glucose 4-epimerase GalE [gamma proteobacterium SS-5]
MGTNPRVLVTGGAGYIGSHACKALARAGYIPVSYDNLVYGHPWAVRWGPLEQGDILDRRRLDEVMARHQPIAVMHFAAYAYVGESVLDPGKYYRNNVVGSLTLLEAMRDHGIDRFVFSSTCATYGEPQHIPMDEAHPQHPINPYGASKLMIERMLEDFAKAHDLKWIALRYFNAAGADPDGEVGERHDPETHLIPLVLDAAAGLRPSITVYGDDYATEDGTCIRDYIHVSDLAEAHVLALQALQPPDLSPKLHPEGWEDCANTAYNLGNGQGFSVRQVIALASQITGCRIPVVHGPRRPGDPPRLIADAGLALKHLGWQPRHASLEAIIASAWYWHRQGLDGPSIPVGRSCRRAPPARYGRSGSRQSG